jgi:hypothetical protein
MPPFFRNGPAALEQSEPAGIESMTSDPPCPGVMSSKDSPGAPTRAGAVFGRYCAEFLCPAIA